MDYTTPSALDDSASAAATIAPGGDVVFTIGPEGRRVRVFSLFARTASPVLDAMLSPYFKEGYQLKQLGETEIPLPDDNAKALEIIFTIIHGQNDKVPDTLTPEELLQIAITGDKYCCFTALKFAIDKWLDHTYNIIDPGDPAETWTLALAALVFNRQSTFAKVTSSLVLCHAGSYLDLVRKDEVPDRATQIKTAAMLEIARNKLRQHLLTEVLKSDFAIKKGQHRPNGFKVFMQRTSNLIEDSISSNIEALTREKRLPPADYWDDICRMEHVFHSIAESCVAVHEADNGLCLKCAKTDEAHEKHATATAGGVASSS
ncbi:hypothetical protein NLG97_g1235 [Lecanicillium saksenae]|uniref:Uncharacterized protein n=1 Tax=Lecanicillium saksenae TaxID=468837 RepID=A0ACC1R6Z7_9HYPO|nr:hypothetical protein NLG97_g1235 [Lecanicillium saksenae]